MAVASAGMATPGSTSQLRSSPFPSPRKAVTIRAVSTSSPVVSVSKATSGPAAQPTISATGLNPGHSANPPARLRALLSQGQSTPLANASDRPGSAPLQRAVGVFPNRLIRQRLAQLALTAPRRECIAVECIGRNPRRRYLDVRTAGGEAPIGKLGVDLRLERLLETAGR